MKFRPTRGRILIRPHDAEAVVRKDGYRQIGSIIIPQTVRLETPGCGVIIALGPPEIDDYDDREVPFPAKVGDIVWYEQNAKGTFTELLIDGVEHMVTRQRYMGAYQPREECVSPIDGEPIAVDDDFREALQHPEVQAAYGEEGA